MLKQRKNKSKNTQWLLSSLLGIIFFLFVLQGCSQSNSSTPMNTTRIIEPPPLGNDEDKNKEYSGDSSFAVCTTDTDCVSSGCNGELCLGKKQETFMSVCIVPTKPLPKYFGYHCGCTTEQCQWMK